MRRLVALALLALAAVFAGTAGLAVVFSDAGPVISDPVMPPSDGG